MLACSETQRQTPGPDSMKAPTLSPILGLAVLLFELTVSADRSVILEFPKPPVIVGSDVTLHCKTRDGSIQTGYFFRNGSFIGVGLTGEFTISRVQRSHEGFYSCSTGLFSRSSESWLSVRDPPPPAPSWPVVRLLCHLVVVCLYFISTVLMVSVYCSKRRGNKSAVSMVMDNHAEGGQKLAEEHYYISG